MSDAAERKRAYDREHFRKQYHARTAAGRAFRERHHENQARWYASLDEEQLAKRRDHARVKMREIRARRKAEAAEAAALGRVVVTKVRRRRKRKTPEKGAAVTVETVKGAAKGKTAAKGPGKGRSTLGARGAAPVKAKLTKAVPVKKAVTKGKVVPAKKAGKGTAGTRKRGRKPKARKG